MIDDPRSWLITVARNKLVDHLRRATHPSPALHIVVDDTMAVVDGGVDVARLLELLPSRLRLNGPGRRRLTEPAGLSHSVG